MMFEALANHIVYQWLGIDLEDAIATAIVEFGLGSKWLQFGQIADPGTADA